MFDLISFTLITPEQGYAYGFVLKINATMASNKR